MEDIKNIELQKEIEKYKRASKEVWREKIATLTAELKGRKELRKEIMKEIPLMFDKIGSEDTAINKEDIEHIKIAFKNRFKERFGE